MPNNTRTRPSRSRLALLAAVALALTLTLGFAACSSSGSSKSAGSNSATSAAITVKDFQFTTKPVTAGATVTVHSNGPSDHTVTADNGEFNVSVSSGKDVTFTAPAKAGTYKFHCSIHTQMHGILTVQ